MSGAPSSTKERLLDVPKKGRKRGKYVMRIDAEFRKMKQQRDRNKPLQVLQPSDMSELIKLVRLTPVLGRLEVLSEWVLPKLQNSQLATSFSSEGGLALACEWLVNAVDANPRDQSEIQKLDNGIRKVLRSLIRMKIKFGERSAENSGLLTTVRRAVATTQDSGIAEIGNSLLAWYGRKNEPFTPTFATGSAREPKRGGSSKRVSFASESEIKQERKFYKHEPIEKRSARKGSVGLNGASVGFQSRRGTKRARPMCKSSSSASLVAWSAPRKFPGAFERGKGSTEARRIEEYNNSIFAEVYAFDDQIPEEPATEDMVVVDTPSNVPRVKNAADAPQKDITAEDVDELFTFVTENSGANLALTALSAQPAAKMQQPWQRPPKRSRYNTPANAAAAGSGPPLPIRGGYGPPPGQRYIPPAPGPRYVPAPRAQQRVPPRYEERPRTHPPASAWGPLPPKRPRDGAVGFGRGAAPGYGRQRRY